MKIEDIKLKLSSIFNHFKNKRKAIDYINSCIKSPCKDPSIIRGYCPDIMFITTHNNIKFNEQLFWMFNNRNIIQIFHFILNYAIFYHFIS